MSDRIMHGEMPRIVTRDTRSGPLAPTVLAGSVEEMVQWASATVGARPRRPVIVVRWGAR